MRFFKFPRDGARWSVCRRYGVRLTRDSPLLQRLKIEKGTWQLSCPLLAHTLPQVLAEATKLVLQHYAWARTGPRYKRSGWSAWRRVRVDNAVVKGAVTDLTGR